MSHADWYFDFISPFSYLQFERMQELPVASVTLKPILFAGLLKHFGQLGPAEIPAKRTFTYRHVTWMARQHSIAFRFPPAHPFHPLKALRLAIALGSEREAIQCIFRFIWAEGRDPNEEWPALCAHVDLEVEDAEARIGDDRVKQTLRLNSEGAISKGVFGVPTFVIDGKLFWGVDATGMVADYARDRDAFEDDEMRRVSDLPAAIQRSGA